MADNTVSAPDPALLLRAKQAYAKLDPKTKADLREANISEAQWEASAVARYAADARATDGGLHFDAAALAKDHLEPLADVSAEEEADARVIAEATPATMAQAEAALARLRANGQVPEEVYAAYSAQVDALKTKAPTTRDEQDQALLVKVYQDVHGRAPDPGGAKYWGEQMKKLRAGGMSDEQIVAKLEQDGKRSPEYQMKHGGGTYVAQAGETLAALAPLFGAKLEDLAAKNGLDPNAVLEAGFKLQWQTDGTEAAKANAQASANQAQGATGQAATAKAGQVPYLNQYSASLFNKDSNCGPTSMAMIARAMGYGQGMTDGQLIADLGKAGGTTAAGTGWAGIKAMAAKMGKPCEEHGPDANWIKQQLEAGKLVCANGDYYALPPHGGGHGGHYVAIVGLDKQGNFLVDDPADKAISPKAYTAAQIERFLRANGNGGRAFAVG